jgi:hypothetical protein
MLDGVFESTIHEFVHFFNPDDILEHVCQVWLHFQWQHCRCCLTSLSRATSCSIERTLFFSPMPLACLLRNILMSLVTCKKEVVYGYILTSSHFTHLFIISCVTCGNRYKVWICFYGLSPREVIWNTDMFLETAVSSQKCRLHSKMT